MISYRVRWSVWSDLSDQQSHIRISWHQIGYTAGFGEAILDTLKGVKASEKCQLKPKTDTINSILANWGEREEMNMLQIIFSITLITNKISLRRISLRESHWESQFSHYSRYYRQQFANKKCWAKDSFQCSQSTLWRKTYHISALPKTLRFISKTQPPATKIQNDLPPKFENDMHRNVLPIFQRRQCLKTSTVPFQNVLSRRVDETNMSIWQYR